MGFSFFLFLSWSFEWRARAAAARFANGSLIFSVMPDTPGSGFFFFFNHFHIFLVALLFLLLSNGLLEVDLVTGGRWYLFKLYEKKIPSPFASSSARIRSWSVRGLLKEITAPQSFFFFLFFSQNRKPVVFVVVVFLSSLFPFWWCPFLFSHFSGRIGSDSTQPGGNVGSTGGKEMANLLQPEKGEIQRERWEKGEEEEEEEKRRWRLLHATKDVSPASSSSFFRSIFYSNRIFSRPGHHQKTLLSFAWLPLTFQSLHPLPILQFIFIPSKVNKKRKKRERVKIQKKTSFSICLPKNVFSIVFIVGKHFKSRCQQRSCVVFYFLLWHWLSFFFSLALLAIVLWPAKMDSLPRSKRKSEWWHASGSFFYFKNEKKILLISKKLLLFCHLKTTWKMCFCVFNLFWLIHKFFLYL